VPVEIEPQDHPCQYGGFASVKNALNLDSDQEGILLLEYQNSSGGDADTFGCVKDFKGSPARGVIAVENSY
jgi:hypothetical protein